MATAFLRTCRSASIDFGYSFSAPTLPSATNNNLQPQSTVSDSSASCSSGTWELGGWDQGRGRFGRPAGAAGRPREAPLPRSAYADDHRRSDMPKSLIFLLYRGQCGDCGVRVGPDPHPRATRKMLRKRETPAKGHYRFLQFTSRPAVPKACGNLT